MTRHGPRSAAADPLSWLQPHAIVMFTGYALARDRRRREAMEQQP
jgi:cytochrome c-type biogenesis protein CcmH/NrfF